jgi:hypothetical protein
MMLKQKYADRERRKEINGDARLIFQQKFREEKMLLENREAAEIEKVLRYLHSWTCVDGKWRLGI